MPKAFSTVTSTPAAETGSAHPPRVTTEQSFPPGPASGQPSPTAAHSTTSTIAAFDGKPPECSGGGMDHRLSISFLLAYKALSLAQRSMESTIELLVNGTHYA
eukprot:1986658-Amphidinium_carterae.1